ncbi:glucuronoxylan 4-O-methyltransferase 1-like [Phalaenopsis equestris]|uniref:glucuronoxylan 4-O-methyltransferase 1-like n=1 Tax=Phalaenopsis equestris TaxID=78828 RepID=UPI0009E24652|nr:glucuronoxylan 4-O-methyltransferase 1-like [Phalaenopsis equestris]
MKSKLSYLFRKMTWSRIQNSLHIKLLLLTLLLLFLFLLLLRPNPSSSQSPTLTAASTASCSTKIPETLAETIIHYATSNTTPQQTRAEISVAAGVLQHRSPCRFLVFGLGLDSPMWAGLNHGGRTIFLEEDESWIAKVRARFPSLEAYHVRYDTRVRDADDLMEIGRRPECSSSAAEKKGLRDSACRLALKGLPDVFYEGDWDLIMVDAPTGWIPEAPGRMGAIYTAGMAARGRNGDGETDIFVHDVDRKVEDEFSKQFLCEGYLVEQVGRLRHFRLPSYRKKEMPFCPSVM